mmetsp:Transcript_6633/g.20908  ORF Transcript_6633/g.20908 Transcript_6633/m.20908 type:complete len:261 (-) Transcript_6633:188-970(-)
MDRQLLVARRAAQRRARRRRDRGGVRRARAPRETPRGRAAQAVAAGAELLARGAFARAVRGELRHVPRRGQGVARAGRLRGLGLVLLRDADRGATALLLRLLVLPLQVLRAARHVPAVLGARAPAAALRAPRVPPRGGALYGVGLRRVPADAGLRRPDREHGRPRRHVLLLRARRAQAAHGLEGLGHAAPDLSVQRLVRAPRGHALGRPRTRRVVRRRPRARRQRRVQRHTALSFRGRARVVKEGAEEGCPEEGVNSQNT